MKKPSAVYPSADKSLGSQSMNYWKSPTKTTESFEFPALVYSCKRINTRERTFDMKEWAIFIRQKHHFDCSLSYKSVVFF